MTRPVSATGDDAVRPRRLRREQRTVEVMVAMYCRAHHQTDIRDASVTTPSAASDTDPTSTTLCPACVALLDYSGLRIDACRFGDQKPTCAHCTVHCFRSDKRQRIREVMRYAGPRMMLRHPYLAVRHLLDRHHAPPRL